MNEVNLAGTIRGAAWVEDIQHSWDVFLRDLIDLEADRLSAADAAAAQQAAARVNKILKLVLAEPFLREHPPPGFPPPGLPVPGGTMSRQGIRTDQSLWLSYRDAWLHFAALRKPTLPLSTVRTWITDQRIRNLDCFPCTQPTLSPSNMQTMEPTD